MLAGKRILVLEDEVLILLDLETVLRQAGAEVFSISSVRAARAVVNAHSLDAALLDVHLNGNGALDAENCQEIADNLNERGVPFAFITGETEMTCWDSVYQAPLLKKPYLPEHVLTVADHLVTDPPGEALDGDISGHTPDL